MYVYAKTSYRKIEEVFKKTERKWMEWRQRVAASSAYACGDGSQNLIRNKRCPLIVFLGFTLCRFTKQYSPPFYITHRSKFMHTD